MLNELSSRFLKVLKYLIEEHEVTDNKDFASKISVSTSMITEISKGRSNVGLSAIQNTVLQFPVNSDWLLTGRGSMLRDNKNPEESKRSSTPITTPISPVEESIIYKMYEKEKEENKVLIEKIGGLKERIRQLESQNKESEHQSKESETGEAFTSESSGDYGEGSLLTKQPITSKRSSAGKT